MAAEDVGVAGEGFVALVDGVAADDGGSATDTRLGVDDGVAADDGGVAGDAAGDGEVSEEDEDVSGDVALDLDGAEEAAGVADVLAGGDEDVLAEVGAVGAGVGLGGGGCVRSLRVGVERCGEEERDSRVFDPRDGQRFAPLASAQRPCRGSYAAGDGLVP